MADVIACPDCAAIQRLPDLRRGGLVECRRCGSTLERSNGRSLDAALACATATLLLLFPANLLPLMSVSILGTDRASRLGAGVVVMWQQHFVLIALVVAAQAVVLPFFRFGLLASVLAALRFGRPGAWIGTAFRWSERLDLWAMPDVFLIGLFVGYARVRTSLPVEIGDGGWCIIGAAFLTMVTRASLDRRTIWRRIEPPDSVPPTGLACTSCDLVTDQCEPGARCPRCRARLWPRKPFSIMRTAALLATGYLLYPVANIYPMSIAVQLGSPKPHTIFDGVQELIGANLWPLAAIIFLTSIGIPLLKLIGLTWLCISVRRKSRWALRTRTRVYRVIHEIGRWSNVDIYTIVVFLPLMQFGQLVSIRAATGAVAFLAVVVVSMIAARWFDPRLMWDAAGEPR
jgi:paraquat-inducible protein A